MRGQRRQRVLVREGQDARGYILDQVTPRMAVAPDAVGTSFGALHSVLLALRHPSRVSGFIGMSGAYDVQRWLDGYFDNSVYFTNPFAFLPGLIDPAYLDPLKKMQKKVIQREKGGDPRLDVWPGWSHDWHFRKDMMRRYV
ncbi:MAG: hypothetical protein E6I22_11315 [Chloroflexi bacterium]|nr:MAG: hypothetical protein E6I22_11315 [Chloroflexota bacterium]